MPLPEVPNNQTDRYFIDYSSANGEHTMLVRLRGDLRGAPAQDLITLLVASYGAIAPPQTIFREVRFSAAGSTVSLPLFNINLVGFGAGTPGNEDLTRFITFVGRSSTGRRVRQTLFAPAVQPDVDYRVPRGVLSGVDGVLDFLQQNTGNFVGVDGQPVQAWYDYANTGFNAYYQRRARRIR